MGSLGKTSLEKIFGKVLGYCAPQNSPVFIGTPTVPTADGTVKEQVANVEFVKKYVASQLQSDINYTITITQSDNQTITVTAGGVAHTETFTAPKGTDYTVSIQAADGYTAGTLSTTRGTLYTDINISATNAVMLLSGDSGKIHVDVDTGMAFKKLKCGNNIKVVKVSMMNMGNSYASPYIKNSGSGVYWIAEKESIAPALAVGKYVGVTPGKEYSLSFNILGSNFNNGTGRALIEWSSEINDHTPEVTDY